MYTLMHSTFLEDIDIAIASDNLLYDIYMHSVHDSITIMITYYHPLIFQYTCIV